MATSAHTKDELREEIATLRAQLAEAIATLDAIRSGEVDALVVTGTQGAQIYTLKDADRPYRVLIEEMRQGALTVDSSGIILFANRRVSELLRTSQEKLLGTALRDFVPDEARPLYDSLLRAGLAGNSEGEISLRSEGGGIPVHVAVNALPIDTGIAGVLVTDLTAQKRHQAERIQLLSEHAARITAEQADRRKDEFIATLAHELRNPLAPIRNALELMRLGKTGGAAKEEPRVMIERQLKLLVRLVDDLLDVARINTGKFELRRERTELTALVNSAAEMSRPRIEADRHALSVSLPSQALWLDADPARLVQMLSNLLDNAAKYTQPGGSIRVAVEQEGGKAVVSVTDTGIGIPLDMLERVFDMFAQVDQSLERSHGGLGIGLTLVKRLVELHGGDIVAESAGVGMGSTFSVRLPLVEAPREPAAREIAALDTAARNAAGISDANAVQATLRVMVVDDNVDAAATLGMLLQHMGHDVNIAHDGERALQAAAAHNPDVIFMDIGLPEMSGYQVARRMRTDLGLTSAYIVALTGYGSTVDQCNSREAGFNMHIVKPIEPDQLRDLMANLSASHPST
jgi:PAS domain S-box-containing protein